MSATTNIGWCDSTANAVIGCSKISEGCKNCYAAIDTPARVRRHRKASPIETWGEKGVRDQVLSFEKTMLAMNRRPWICDICGSSSAEHLLCSCESLTDLHRRRIFADSNSDWLDERWPIETLAHFLDVIRRCDQCVIQLLTKRPENFFHRLIQVALHAGGYRDKQLGDKPTAEPNEALLQFVVDWSKEHKAPKHIWIGVSCENQDVADERIPELLKIPAAVRFLSCEPLLGPMDLYYSAFNGADSFGRLEGIQWVIVGGESGPNRRPMELGWLESIGRQCKGAGVACYVKQDCALKAGQQGRIANDVWKVKEFPR